MANGRRKGAADSTLRLDLILCAKQIIADEGFAALTASRLATIFNLSRHTVHYYFGTMEELVLAVMRHEGDETTAWYSRALASENPMKAIWAPPRNFSPRTFELIAMSLRSEAIRVELRRQQILFRNMFAEAIQKHFDDKGISPSVPPVTIGMILLSLSRSIAADEALEVEEGLSETREYIDHWINSLETGL